MKQADGNPWDDVDQRFPPGTVVEGMVRNLTSYGAFIELEDGIDGLLHVSDMSWTKKIANPGDVLEKGKQIKAVVLSVHPDKKRIALGLKQLELDPWQDEILKRFAPETEHAGVVTKVTNFGIFVGLDEELEGLLHVSELTPADELGAGEAVAVRVLRLDTDGRKIALTIVRDENAQEILDGAEELLARLGTAAAAAAEARAAANAAAGVDPDEPADPTLEDSTEDAAPAADADPAADAAEAPAAEAPAGEAAAPEATESPAAEEAPATEAPAEEAPAAEAPAEEAPAADASPEAPEGETEGKTDA